LQQPFERMPTVLTAEEIINKAFLASTRLEINCRASSPPSLRPRSGRGPG